MPMMTSGIFGFVLQVRYWLSKSDEVLRTSVGGHHRSCADSIDRIPLQTYATESLFRDYDAGL